MTGLHRHWRQVGLLWLICLGWFFLSLFLGFIWFIGAWAAVFPWVTLYFTVLTLLIFIRKLFRS
jgi:hypothetical protein